MKEGPRPSRPGVHSRSRRHPLVTLPKILGRLSFLVTASHPPSSPPADPFFSGFLYRSNSGTLWSRWKIRWHENPGPFAGFTRPHHGLYLDLQLFPRLPRETSAKHCERCIGRDLGDLGYAIGSVPYDRWLNEGSNSVVTDFLLPSPPNITRDGVFGSRAQAQVSWSPLSPRLFSLFVSFHTSPRPLPPSLLSLAALSVQPSMLNVVTIFPQRPFARHRFSRQGRLGV